MKIQKFLFISILVLCSCGGSSEIPSDPQIIGNTSGDSTGGSSDSGVSTDSGASSDSGTVDSGAGDESSSGGSSASDGLDDGSNTSTGSDAGSDSTSGDTTSGTTDDGTTDSGTSDGGTSDGGSSTTGGSTTSLPPDPADVAPTLDPTVTTTLGVASEFIYTGSNPIQTGVEEGTIDPVHVAVIRGKVFDKAGNPLSGVNITIHNHSEYGSTKTREDGVFDMVVNGGGYLTVVYQKEGYPTAHRKVDAPWQDYVWADDVVMVEYDTNVTTIDLTTDTLQVGEGSLSSDDDGDRTATVMFPAGTTATMVLEDGTEEPITTLNFRATEYTVGENGPESMPASLPANSAYTYAVELSVDEAVTAGATEITFNQPVYFYVENFLDFPVGEPVPTGYYDKEKSAWVPSDNGVIIEILGDEDGDGRTEIDSDGDGVADDEATLTDLGFTDEERETLASRYVTGQTLWRVGLEHFSSWDCNWPFGPPDDAEDPDEDPDDDKDKKEDCSNTQSGSIIECQNQTLGEEIPVIGTLFTLNYRSDRVPGRKTNNTLNIQVSGDSIPASLKHILLEITVAGRFFEIELPAETNQAYEFEWDGLDAYGRNVTGSEEAKVHIGYVYNGVYYSGSGGSRSFGTSGNGTEITGSRTRQEIGLWQTYTVNVEKVSDQKEFGFGSWSLSAHHLYDVNEKKIYFGNGERQTSKDLPTGIVTIVGGGDATHSEIRDSGGMPATEANIHLPVTMAIDNGGNLYFTNGTLYKVSTEGIITDVDIDYSLVGTEYDTFSEDALAIDSNGNLYISDQNNHIVLKIDSSGLATIVAGVYESSGYSGDEGLATEAELDTPSSLAVDRDGNLYISDYLNYAIRKVDTSGIITTIVGTGSIGTSGSGVIAKESEIHAPAGLSVDKDGNLYFSEKSICRVRKIDNSGILTTVAGTAPSSYGFRRCGYTGDGGLATDAKLDDPAGTAVDDEGNLYIADSENHVIRKVDISGVITTVAGIGDDGGYSGDGGLPTKAKLKNPNDVALDPYGNLYIADMLNKVIRQLNPILSGFDAEDIVVASQDGSELYKFNSYGKHQSTIDTKTGATLYSFGYDENGLLNTITDVDGNITTINHDSNGNPTSIVGPYGQTTILEVDENGYLKTVTNPAGESYSMIYDDEGLLQSFTNPRGYASTFEYDSLGRLTKDINAAGQAQTLERSTTDDGYQVTHKSPEGAESIYKVETNSTDDKTLTNTNPDGTQNITTKAPDGTIETTYPDGTKVSVLLGPDPRFGMQSPITESSTVTTPSGLTYEYSMESDVELSDEDDLLSLTEETKTITVNGRVYTYVYDAASLEETFTTPELRELVSTFNASGKLVKKQKGSIEPSNYTYDSNGRLSTITYGTTSSRTYTFDYYTDDDSSKGLLKSITDPLSQTTSFEYDDAGRIIFQTEPDGRTISYNYDENGNVTSITPPGKPDHLFTYNNLDLQSTYVAPDIGLSSQTTQYAYNKDKKIDLITRPDGKTIDLEYNSVGKLETIEADGEVYSYNYNSTSGQLISVDDPFGGSLTFTYDGSLLLSSTLTGDVTGSVSFTYDDNFWVTKQTINSSTNIDFAYDDDGLLTQAGSEVITRSPDHGMITGTSLSDVSSTTTYTEIGELESEDFSYAGSSIYSTTYTRDDLGRITDKTVINSGTTIPYSYTYDEAGRLETATYVSSTTTYTYDNNGNRLTKTKDGVTTIATYDDQDRLLTYGDNTYTYTDNGELLTKTNLEGTTTYNYDVLGNLKTVSLSDGTEIEYVIDGQNRRVGKKIGGVLTQGFIYKSQLKPVAELDGSNNIISTFIYASKENIPDYMVKEGITYQIISDQIGSPQLIVNVNDGSITQEITYDEFGNILSDTNPGFQPFGFAGGIYDQHTKLTRFGARDYDAEAGRWTARDPINFDGGDSNLYGYVLNDPCNWFDVNGLSRDSYRADPNGHGKNPDGSPKDPHVDRMNEHGQKVGRYNPDGTPRKNAPPVPKSDQKKWEDALKDLLKYINRFPLCPIYIKLDPCIYDPYGFECMQQSKPRTYI